MKQYIVGTSLLAIAMVFGAGLAFASSTSLQGNLTAPSGPNPFGGSVVGNYSVAINGNEIKIKANVTTSAPAGYVYEAWLVDTQTTYKLSLGQLKDGSLEFKQNMLNPLTYGVVVITNEPVGDLNPNPDMPAGGALLLAPFGQ